MLQNNRSSRASLVALVILIFCFTPVFAATKYKVIYSFQGGTDGAYPISDLVADAQGNLYGTTSQGGTGCGSQGCGTVFELVKTKSGWQHQVLYTFGEHPKDGEYPQSGLVFDRLGNLYGTTAWGGGFGNVYKLMQDSRGHWTESVIYSFTGGSDGAYPTANPVFDVGGNLYGTTTIGGTGCNSDNECGTVFELTPQAKGAWTETTIYSFTGAPDGATPSSGVFLDSAGNIYGLTLYGGTGSCHTYGFYSVAGCGTLYKITPGAGGAWTEAILYSFNRGCGLAVYPSGEMLFDNAGHLFGISRAGGNGRGAAFELRDTKNSWQQNIVHRFFGPDGIRPTGRLVKDANGDLLGVAYFGGVHKQYGTVFQIHHSKAGWKEQILHSFGGAGDGVNPQAGLLLDRPGNLYGTTEFGGSGKSCNGGCGTIYEIEP